jgi:hypothetical protein
LNAFLGESLLLRALLGGVLSGSFFRAPSVFYSPAQRGTPLGPFVCGANKAGIIYSVPLNICRVVLLLLRQCRGAAGNGLRTTIKYLRRTTSGAAGNGLGTTIKYLRRTTSGAAG